MCSLNYDDWDDYTFLTYVVECGFRFSQNDDCSKFELLRGWNRNVFGSADNWYYSLQFTISDLKINCVAEYNNAHLNNKYTFEYLNEIILPSIYIFIEEFGIFDKNKINTFVINLINEIG